MMFSVLIKLCIPVSKSRIDLRHSQYMGIDRVHPKNILVHAFRNHTYCKLHVRILNFSSKFCMDCRYRNVNKSVCFSNSLVSIVRFLNSTSLLSTSVMYYCAYINQKITLLTFFRCYSVRFRWRFWAIEFQCDVFPLCLEHRNAMNLVMTMLHSDFQVIFINNNIPTGSTRPIHDGYRCIRATPTRTALPNLRHKKMCHVGFYIFSST